MKKRFLFLFFTTTVGWSLKYEVFGMLSFYENEPRANYLTQRWKKDFYKISIREGLVYRNETLLRSGHYEYVMDGDGNIYVGKNRGHSGYLAGGRLAASGMWFLPEDGVLQIADNASGHYKLPLRTLDSLASELNERGLGLRGIDFVPYDYGMILESTQRMSFSLSTECRLALKALMP